MTRGPFRRSSDSERGAVLVMTTLLIATLFGMVAIVIDLGALRSDVQVDQSVADLAALAGGKSLGANNPTAACQAAVIYMNANANLSSTISPSSFCSTMGTTSCSGGTSQATPTTTVGSNTVSIHYPVPDSEIRDSHLVGGARLNDGFACQRMRVIISSTHHSLFASILGVSSLSATRTATVRPWPVGVQKTPALWLLDPTGCTAFSVGGGSQVTVGTPSIRGIITVDSDGTTCQSNQHTISSSGAGTNLTAVPTTGTDAGLIQLFALPASATTCSGTACDQSDVNNGRLTPQPTSASNRATRSRVDDIYNCHMSYPTYHGITLGSTCNPSTTPPYIDNLKTAIGTSGAPPGYSRWTQSYSCNAPSGTTSVTGNWWIDCPSGLSIGNGTNVEFRDGNVVFDQGLNMTGGTLKFNTNNSATTLPTSCTPPAVVTPCITKTSSRAAFVYLRNGDINITGGVVTANHTMVYSASGYVKVNSSPPTWLAPTEGPFRYLGLWADMPSTSNNVNKFTMAGGAGVQLSGVFFTPEAAPFTLTGGGNWGQQNAQFISYQLQVSGGGTLTMAPDPTDAVKAPILAGTLIR